MAQVETILAGKASYFTPAEGAAYYGRARSLETVVAHHWDSLEKRQAGQVTFSGTERYLRTVGVPSANDVIGYDESNGRIRVINQVQYPNVAFTSGGSINQRSVGIETDPFIEDPNHPQRAGLIEAFAQRAFDYCKIANKRLTVTAHRDYQQTACPGNFPFAEVNARLDQLWNAYINPAPTPPVVTPPAKSTYTRLPAPQVWLTQKQPTQLWNLDFNSWPEAKAVKPFNPNTPITIVGVAQHPLGGEYLMTSYAFGNADKTGVPDHNQGFNKKDMAKAPDEPTTPPVEPPVVTPPIEPPVTPPVDPTPTPTPPTEHDKEQDKQITWLMGTLNSLLAVLREFAENILKIGK